MWWARDGACSRWELDVELDDDDGVQGLARRAEVIGAQRRTVAYRITVSAVGEIGAQGPTATVSSGLGRGTSTGSAACANRFASASHIDGGVRLSSASGDELVLDERWYFTAEACEAGKSAPVAGGCGR